MTASQGPPPLTLRTPVVAVTLPPPATISVTLRPAPPITVAWPPVRVTQARRPARPDVITLPARQPQHMQRGTKKLRIWSPPPRR